MCYVLVRGHMAEYLHSACASNELFSASTLLSSEYSEYLFTSKYSILDLYLNL